MKLSVYLHDEIRAVLCCYGTLDEVVNRVLDAGSAGEFDLMNKPQIPTRDGAGRYDVDVTNEEYLELLRLHPHNSTKVSLRRLLYWFVENEMYEMLGWEPVKNYVDRNDVKAARIIKRLRQDFEKLLLVIDNRNYENVETAYQIIKDLEK